jgi:iron complex outermembrane receptor protein
MGVARRISGFLIACAIARVARAQNLDATLPTVDVPVAPGDGSAGPARASQSAPVAPRPPIDPRDETGQVTRVDATAYAGELRSTAELVATAPGTDVHRLGDQGQLATVTLRGSSTDQVLVLLDGIPLTSAAGGTVDLSTIPQGLIDHIDVLRGDAAARYGSGALGGVVNVVTKTPGPHQGEADLSYGAWNTLAASASDGAVAGPASGSLALSLFRSDGDFTFARNLTPDLGTASQQQTRQNNQSLSLGALGSGSLSIGGGTLRTALQGAFIDRGLAGTEFDLTLRDHAREGRGLWGVSWTLPSALGPFDLEVLGHGRVDSLDVQLFEGPGSAGQLDLEAGLEATLSATLGFQRLSLSASASDEALEASDGSPARGTVSASAADRFTFFSERLAIVPAARVDEVGQFFGVSPKLGVSFFPPGIAGSPLELRANVGEGFRAPTFGELYLEQGIAQPNPNLSPETNLSADLGASLRWARTLFSVTGFISRYDNLILYEFYPPQAAKPFNAGRSVVEGIEAEVVARPLRSLTLVASYTFINAYDNDPASYTYGRALPFKPAQHAHGRASWQYGRLRASLEADLATGQTLNKAATLSIPGHSELDAAVGFRLWNRPAVWLTGGARNLLNDQTPDTFGYPLPGLAFFASLQLNEVASKEVKGDSPQ